MVPPLPTDSQHTSKLVHSNPSTKISVVKLLGSGRVIVKDNHGTLTTFHRRDVKPINMDIKEADLFTEERNTTTRDANHTMPKVKIPDLGWKDYLPPEINHLDYIAIEQGKVEDLEYNCTE